MLYFLIEIRFKDLRVEYIKKENNTHFDGKNNCGKPHSMNSLIKNNWKQDMEPSNEHTHTYIQSKTEKMKIMKKKIKQMQF